MVKLEEPKWGQYPIDKCLLKNIKEMQLEKPLPIQARSLRAALLHDKHVLGAARTGSGKTLAYALPVLNRILSNPNGSSMLKRRLMKTLSKKEDFELIDGEMMAVEDMIVDHDIENQSEVSGDMSDNDDDDEEEAEDEEQESDEDSAHCRLGPNAVVLVPTRELAVQVKEEFDKLCNNTELRCCCIIGGISQDKQIRTLNKLKPHVVIATPGRLHDIVQTDVVQFLNVQSMASLQTLVIDEADRMVQKGHFEEMLKLIDMLKESKKYRRNESDFYRVYLFSATLTFLHELPERFRTSALLTKDPKKSTKKSKEKKIVNPHEHTKKNKIKRILVLLGIEIKETRIIDLSDDDASSCGRPKSDQLSETRVNCLAREKDLYLYYFLIHNPNSRTLVFCNSKDCLRRLSNILKYLGYETLKLHSEMDQKKRLSNLERFRKNPNSILIATDVAARGLDIKDLNSVVHYQVPRTCESYIHRSGRTARVFNKGSCLTLCEPKEVPLYRRLCSNINGGKDLDMYDVDMHRLATLKTRVQMAQQCDKLDHRLRETKTNKNWFFKAAKECEIELDDEDIRQLSGKGKSRQQNVEDDATDRRKLKGLQKQLNALLNRPPFRT